jgi:hypothetical protein
MAARRPASGPWHVSPVVDAAAYHYAWLAMLIPLLFSGSRYPADYIFLFCLVAAANTAHQLLTPALVYVDREIYRRDPLLFGGAPVLVLVASAAALALSTRSYPAFLAVLGASALISTVWNFWHVYMQKYGILRMYNARSDAKTKVPGWSDRLFVFAWLPLYFAMLGPRYRELLMALFPLMRGKLAPLIVALSAAAAWMVPAAVALAAGSVLVFLLHERRSGVLSWPRLSMGLGMTGLAASILLFDPIKAVLAFGFSHLVEYFVFVWAYERRRGGAVPGERLAALDRPGAAMLTFVAVSVAVLMVAVGWGRLFSPGSRYPVVLGLPFERIGTVFVVYQSLFHFYVDGGIWKIRRGHS